MLISHPTKSDPWEALGVRRVLLPHLYTVTEHTVHILQGPAPILALRGYPPPLPTLA